MAARVVARARLAFNWEVIQYDRPSYGHYIWYRNITNNSVQATFPCAEIKAQLQQCDASIQLADNDTSARASAAFKLVPFSEFLMLGSPKSPGHLFHSCGHLSL